MERFLDGIGDLGFRITFNLFCRPDAVEAALFGRLKGAGLQGVYLGVESVWGPDLKFFRKGLTQRIVLGALDILRELWRPAGYLSPVCSRPTSSGGERRVSRARAGGAQR